MRSRLFSLLLAAAASGILPYAAVAAAPDPLEGLIVRDIRVSGLTHLSPDVVTRNLATRVGEPFRRSRLPLDERRLDELRVFTSVAIRPSLDRDQVVIDVAVTETLRLLPTIALRVTDANGFSAGVGARGINLLGQGGQSGGSVLFGGETAVGVSLDSTTITPGAWYRHIGASYTSRRNSLYEFDEGATSADLRLARNFHHGLRVGGLASLLVLSTGTSGASLSPDGTDVLPTVGGFVTLDTLDSSTNPRRGTWAEAEVDLTSGDASSWTFILDARRFQPLSEKQGLGLFSLATWQTGTVGTTLPAYLQFALGGANTVRGWTLGSRNARNQYIATAEYTYVLRDVTPFSVFGANAYVGLQLAAFSDVGLAWNASSDFRLGSAIDGYGVGLRALVPFVDLIRVDVTFGEPGQGATAYFGVSLKATRQRQRVR